MGETAAVRGVSFGPDGPEVPVQGFGCMRLEEGDSSEVVLRALDLGVGFLDTADLYGNGLNEELVGKALRGRRHEAFLCTKGGALRDESDALQLRGDAAYLTGACEASLKRLRTDVIDLYYLHRRDPEVPIEESVGAMAELVGAGKVRHLGLSEVTVEELRAAHAVHPITALQSEWSLSRRGIEELLPACAELGIAVVPYCPHGRGLIGPDLDASKAWVAEAAPEYAALPERIWSLAQRHGVSPHRIALAWVHQRAEVWNVPVVPIPGTKSVRHLEENVAALGLTLDADELALLEPVPVA
ncbi:aldo/keto reductase [Streptomyces laurentii]|uniref:aldo/keto reductase n=1 Tax=Streptomyces laurentii TaxID=39478 RepID=UPI0036CC920B